MVVSLPVDWRARIFGAFFGFPLDQKNTQILWKNGELANPKSNQKFPISPILILQLIL
jgi:hypothetical protein